MIYTFNLMRFFVLHAFTLALLTLISSGSAFANCERFLLLKSEDIVGDSLALKSVFYTVSRAAPTTAPLLILGESGTGKELLARLVHANSGKERAAGPFIPVNYSAIPKELIESTLFGHEAGSFTGATKNHMGLFERANKGTIFLDEIGDLPLDQQVKLLRVLQERQIQPIGSNKTINVDIRVIAATHRHLPTLVKQGLFREDLYFRLNVIEVNLPPLRERATDIPLIANALLSKTIANNPGLKIKPLGFTSEALEMLKGMQWPGNVRELQNVIERSTIMALHEWLDASDMHFSKDQQVAFLKKNIPQIEIKAEVEPNGNLHTEKSSLFKKYPRFKALALRYINELRRDPRNPTNRAIHEIVKMNRQQYNAFLAVVDPATSEQLPREVDDFFKAAIDDVPEMRIFKKRYYDFLEKRKLTHEQIARVFQTPAKRLTPIAP